MLVATRLLPLAGDLIPIQLLSAWMVVSVFIAGLPLSALPLLILVLSILILGLSFSVFLIFPLLVTLLVVSPTIVLLSFWSWARFLSSFLIPIAPFLLISFLLDLFLLWPLGIRRRCLWKCGDWQRFDLWVVERWDCFCFLVYGLSVLVGWLGCC